MTIQIEYALLAGASYISTRDPKNQFPIPMGWEKILNPDSYFIDPISGFEAITFQKGDEIVISFSGTDPNNSSLLTSPDGKTNVALANGTWADQLLQAAEYYLQIESSSPVGTVITLTGHSLGGGLAALVGVFFGVSATTFDQAPFAASALDLHGDNATELRARLAAKLDENGMRLYTDETLAGLTEYLQLRSGTNNFIPRSDLVNTIRVEGEFLDGGFLGNSPIGNPATLLTHGLADWLLSSFDLHSQALLTAFLQSEQSGANSVNPLQTLSEVSKKLVDLLGMFFKKELFATDVAEDEPNFLDRLVRHEAGMSTEIPADQMVTRFTSDLWKLAQDGGMTMRDGNVSNADLNFVSNALIAFAMQKYYEEKDTSAGYEKQLFIDVTGTGGIQFDIADVYDKTAEALAAGDKIDLTKVKGFDLYFSKYLLQENVFNAEERQLIQSLLPYMRDWYVQAGADALNVTDTLNRNAFMLGGEGSDTLTGGEGADLLVGNAGNDTLKGGAGNDTLLGGAGNDTYVFQTDNSIDTILDKDNQGSIIFDDATLNGGAQYGDNRVYRSGDKKHLYTLVDNKTLIIDGQIVVQNYSKSSETFAIKLDVATTVSAPITNKEILGDLKPIDFDLEKSGVQTQYDELGNVKTAGPEVDRADRLFDSAGNDHIVSGGGDDYVGATEGGNDYIEAGAGRDSVKGGNGNDVIAGGDGADILVGDAGDDQIFASEVISIEAAIAAGHSSNGGAQKDDWLSGGSGDDVLVGGENNDAFSGGNGNDLIIGGAGDDDILGDSDIVPTDFNWTVFDSNGNRIFTPVLGELYPTSGGADIIYAGSGNDYVWAGMGNDIIFGDEGDDRLSGGEGNDVILGGVGGDKIFGGSGADYLDAGADDDQLTGGEGDDILIGGIGDDVTSGGSGRDTYIYNKGDGKDSIIDTKSENNILRFGANVRSSDVILRLGSLMLDLGNGDEVHIEGFDRGDALNSSVVQSFEFADGTQLSVADLLARGFDLDGDEGNNEILGTNIVDRIHGFGGDDLLVAGVGDDNVFGDDGIDELQGGIGDDHLNGGAGNDILFGEEGNDTLDGGEGNDYLDGGAGNDVYRNVNADDFLMDLDGKNTIQFIGNISVDDVQILEDHSYGDSPSLLLSIDGNNVALVNISQEEDGNSYQFSNGISITQYELLGQRFFASVNLTGTESNDILYGYAGDDSLESGAGNDRLFGFDGNDALVGGVGNDVLIGGRGDDYLSGNSGDDTYLFDWNSGYDTIVDGGLFSEKNVIKFAVGIQKENVQFEHQANGDLIIFLVAIDEELNSYVDSEITVQSWYNNPNNKISRIEFDDGSVILSSELDALEVLPIEGSEEDDYLVGTEYSDTLRSFAGDDILDGGAGNDFLEGGDGRDTYVLKYGMGQDKVIDSSQEGNSILLSTGLSFSDIVANQTGDDLYVRIAGLAQGVVLKDYYGNPQNWTVVNETGEIQDVQEIIYATQLIEQNKVDALWHDYAANLKASATNDYLSQGYNVDENGIFHKSWTQSYWVSNMYAELRATTTTNVQTISYFPAYYDGNVVTSTSVQTNVDNWWSYFNNSGLQESTAVLRNIQIYSDDSIINAGPANTYSQSRQQVVAQILWQSPTWTTSYQSPNTFISQGWVYGGAYGTDIIGSVKKESSYLLQSGYVRGQISALHQLGSVPISTGAYPQYSRTNLDSIVTESATIEIHAGTSNNSVYANLNSLVDAGDGNDFVSGAGFAFGGAGDDYLYDGTVLVGGDGDDRLQYGNLLFGGQGNDTMDGGEGASRYLIDPNQFGIDTISDSGTSENEYKEAFYRSLGLDENGDYQYRLENGGRWDLGPESSIFDTYEEAIAYRNSRGWDNDINYIVPLPELPYIAANDYKALQALYDADVIDLDSIEFEEGLDSNDVVLRWAHNSQINLSWGEGKEIYIQMPTEDDAIGTGIEFIQFHDGTIWNMADLEQRAVVAAGTSGDDFIYGSPQDEVINSLAGHDQLSGGGGDDTLIGGLDDDTYVFNLGDDHDTLLEFAGEGEDVLILGEGLYVENTEVHRDGADLLLVFNDSDEVLLKNYFDGSWEQIAFFDGTEWDQAIVATYFMSQASVNDDILTGTDGGDEIHGLAGNDLLSGGLGDDQLFGDDGDDVLIGDGDDVVTDVAGNDILDGGLGADIMVGGKGDDTYIVDNIGDLVMEKLNEGIDLVQSSITYTLTNNVDNLTLIDAEDSSGTGNILNNIIIGNSGVNILDGDAGSDTMMAGTGDDTYIVDNVGDVVIENLDEGTDNIQSSVTYTLSANVENLTLTGSDSINGTGNALNNTIVGNNGGSVLLGLDGNDVLIGNVGDDTLDGGVGVDSMTGGLGNDIYVVDSLDDLINEVANEGNDTVESSFNYVLVSNLENLTLTGSDAVFGGGNSSVNTIAGNSGDNILNGFAGDDTLSGNQGNDLLDGGTGADVMSGGAGDDIFIIDNANDVVMEMSNEGIDAVHSSIDYTLTGNVENLILTAEGDFNGTGNALNNVIVGTAGANLLDGGAGLDILEGGAGNDTYIVDNADDIVIETFNAGLDRVVASIDYVLSENIEELVLSGSESINGTGNALANTIYGNSGNNVMAGLSGDDVYFVQNSSDVVLENVDEGFDTVSSSVTYRLSDNVENLILNGAADNNGTGNSLDNNIFGTAGANVLDGGIGADTLVGGAGNDTYIVDDVNDRVFEMADAGIDAVKSSVSYILVGNLENLILSGAAINGAGNELDNFITGNNADNNLSGAAGNDVLFGGEGDDILDGGTGNDTMIGGDGNDAYFVDSAEDLILETANAGNDTVTSTINYTLAIDIENLTLSGDATLGTGNALNNVITGTDFGSTLSGNAGNDTLNGGIGNDVLDGGTGVDTMSGNSGNDHYVVDDAGDVVIEGIAAGLDEIHSSVSYALSSNVENLTLVGVANIDATGNDLENSLVGNTGDNILDGGLGADVMSAGSGNDTYIVDNVADNVIEVLFGGIDTVKSSVNYVLDDQIENLALTGINDLVGTGNTHVNYIQGNSGNNVIDGGSGADTMIGGAGNDIYIVENAGDLVVESTNEGSDTVRSSISYELSANLENLELVGTNNLFAAGNELGNILTGNAGDNTLDGRAGNDTLSGGSGNDILIGGDGNDTYVYSIGDGLDQLTDSAGIDTLQFGSGLTRGDVALRIVTVNAQKIAQVRVLNGGGCEESDQGINFVVTTAANGQIISPIEKFTFANGQQFVLTDLLIKQTFIPGTSQNDILIGDYNDNVMSGGSGNDQMYGESGDDTMDGGNGVDVLYGGGGADRLYGGDQADTLYGECGNDFLEGRNSADKLYGGGGDDRLLGGSGDDLLDGGDGNDTFDGGSGENFINAGAGDDQIIIGNGSDIVQAGSGNDVIDFTNSSNDDEDDEEDEKNTLIDTGDGDDIIQAGTGQNWIAAGKGNDIIDAGSSHNLFAFNRGDGADTVINSLWDNDTISVGRDIRYADMTLEKAGNDLIFGMGSGDSITLKDWYSGSSHHGVEHLQVVTVAGGDYVAGSSSKLTNDKVELFDFEKLVRRFDTLRAASSINQWSVMNGLLETHLSGTNNSALGGDFSYQYATNGGLSGIGLGIAQDILSSENFGSQNQSLHTRAQLEQDTVKLA